MARDAHDFLKVVIKPHPAPNGVAAPKSSDDSDMGDDSGDMDAADPKDLKRSCAEDIIKAIKDDDADSLVKFLSEFGKYDESEEDDDSEDKS